VNETDIEYHENSRDGLVADTKSQIGRRSVADTKSQTGRRAAAFRTEGILSRLKERLVMTVSTLQKNSFFM